MNKILTVTANPAIDRVYFVDRFTMGKVHRPTKTVYSAGGKGLNVSRVAALLESDVTAFGFLGGYNGDFIRSEIKKFGIHDNFTEIKDETRICINITDNAGVSGEILEKGPLITADDEQCFINSFEKSVTDCDIVTVSGSLPNGLTSEFYLKIAHIAKVKNKNIIFDTSEKNLAEIVNSKPYMIKPNKDEFLKFIGSDNFNSKKALTYLKKIGIRIPFITLGKDGAIAMLNDTFYKFSVPSVEIINTVGSGDSTIAGIAVGISRGMSVLDSIRLGMAAGISNTQFESTGFVSKNTVKEFYDKINISQL